MSTCTLCSEPGLSLAEMLGAALAIYGESFSPLVALKALAYHEDPALAATSGRRAPRPRGGGEGGRSVASSGDHSDPPA